MLRFCFSSSARRRPSCAPLKRLPCAQLRRSWQPFAPCPPHAPTAQSPTNWALLPSAEAPAPTTAIAEAMHGCATVALPRLAGAASDLQMAGPSRRAYVTKSAMGPGAKAPPRPHQRPPQSRLPRPPRSRTWHRQTHGSICSSAPRATHPLPHRLPPPRRLQPLPRHAMPPRATLAPRSRLQRWSAAPSPPLPTRHAHTWTGTTAGSTPHTTLPLRPRLRRRKAVHCA